MCDAGGEKTEVGQSVEPLEVLVHIGRGGKVSRPMTDSLRGAGRHDVKYDATDTTPPPPRRVIFKKTEEILLRFGRPHKQKTSTIA
jgi:hypothetical protein